MTRIFWPTEDLAVELADADAGAIVSSQSSLVFLGLTLTFE